MILLVIWLDNSIFGTSIKKTKQKNKTNNSCHLEQLFRFCDNNFHSFYQFTHHSEILPRDIFNDTHFTAPIPSRPSRRAVNGFEHM